MADNSVIGTNDTQKRIFRAIYNRPLTGKELASITNVKTKTIANNIPLLDREIQDTNPDLKLVRYFDEEKNTLYLITKKPTTELDLKPKIYKVIQARKQPYLIINLPSPPVGYNTWNIYAFGCLHYGAKTCNYKALTKWIDWLDSQPNALVILLGDLIENATRDSIGAGVYEQIIPPHEQKLGVAKLLSKIAHKILYTHRGNHAARSVKAVDQDPERDIANWLQVPFLVGPAYVDIVCQNYLWTACSFHGKSASGTIGGRINATQKRSLWHSAMLNFIGHYHDSQVVKDREIIKDPRKPALTYRKRYYILSGSFMEYFNSYAEEAAYQPLEAGIPKAVLYCNGSNSPGDYWATDS